MISPHTAPEDHGAQVVYERNLWLDELPASFKSVPGVERDTTGTSRDCRTGSVSQPHSEVQFPPLAKDLNADWLIVGAGFTGLAAAFRLAQLRPDDRIILLDAGQIGSGSSSRSSGFVVSLGHFGGSENESRSLYKLGTAAIAQLRNQVNKHNVDCNWNETGRVIAARGQAGLRSLRGIQKRMEAVGSKFKHSSAEEIETLTGMTGYLGGIWQLDSVQVNPATLQLGLMRSLPKNVELYCSTQVQSLRKQNGWLATAAVGQRTVLGESEGDREPGARQASESRTEQGAYSVQATNVIVTNNAFANQLGLAKHRVFPMRTFIGVFEASESAVGLIGSNAEWGLTSVERIGSSVRRVGRRLFLRSTAKVGLDEPVTHDGRFTAMADVEYTLRKNMDARFPDVNFNLETVWSGTIGVTANGSQAFGNVDEGLYLSVGYNGHGIAQGTISGRLLVELALGQRSELLDQIQRLPKPWWIPGDRCLFPIVNGYMRWLNWRFQSEV